MGIIQEVYRAAESRQVGRRELAVVERFWATEAPIPHAILQPVLDRVRLIEKRLLEQRGWKREHLC